MEPSLQSLLTRFEIECTRQAQLLLGQGLTGTQIEAVLVERIRDDASRLRPHAIASAASIHAIAKSLHVPTAAAYRALVLMNVVQNLRQQGHTVEQAIETVLSRLQASHAYQEAETGPTIESPSQRAPRLPAKAPSQPLGVSAGTPKAACSATRPASDASPTSMEGVHPANGSRARSTASLGSAAQGHAAKCPSSSPSSSTRAGDSSSSSSSAASRQPASLRVTDYAVGLRSQQASHAVPPDCKTVTWAAAGPGKGNREGVGRDMAGRKRNRSGGQSAYRGMEQGLEVHVTMGIPPSPGRADARPHGPDDLLEAGSGSRAVDPRGGVQQGQGPERRRASGCNPIKDGSSPRARQYSAGLAGPSASTDSGVVPRHALEKAAAGLAAARGRKKRRVSRPAKHPPKGAGHPSKSTSNRMHGTELRSRRMHPGGGRLDDSAGSQ